MPSSIGWRQTVGFRKIMTVGSRVRYQPVLDDGRGLYRVREPGQWFYRARWRRRLEVILPTEDVTRPILYRSRARAISIARQWEETHEELDGWLGDPEDETDRLPL